MYGIYDVNTSTLIAHLVAPVTVRSNQPIYVSDTMSLKRVTNLRAAQRWEIEANLLPINNGDLFSEIISKGYTGDVKVLMPQVYGNRLPSNRATGTCSASGGVLAGTTVTIAGANGLIPKGTFLKFGNHDKIYMLKNDVTGSGVGQIYPSLRMAVGGGTLVNHFDTLGTFMFDLDTVLGMVFVDGIRMDNGAVKLVEKL
jgi:hypothetical protein